MQVLRAQVEGTLIFANVYIFFLAFWSFSFLPEHLFKLDLQGSTYFLAHCSKFYIVLTNQFQRPKNQVISFKTEIALCAVIVFLLVSFLIVCQNNWIHNLRKEGFILVHSLRAKQLK